MALLGCLSLVQIVFLPGWLALHLLGLKANRLQTAALSFGLSLVVNHFLVVGLVAVHCYRPAPLYCIFAAEVVTALAIGYRSLALPLSSFWRAVDDERRNVALRLGLHLSDPGRSIRWVAVLAAAGVTVVYTAFSLWQFGDIFRQWDAVVSWNRWAVDWAHDGWPQTTSLYPQLLPTNISITYVFMQTSEIWCFAKGFQFLFCLMTMACMFDLAVVRRSSGMMVGVALAYLLFVAVLRFRMLASGYADVPVAFFATSSLIMLFLAADCTEKSQRTKYLAAGCILVVGAALTKQVGLYMAGIYPLLAWRIVFARQETWSNIRPQLLRMALAVAILAGPWYILKKLEIRQGYDHDNTLSLMQGYQQGRSLPQRFVYAGESLAQAVTPLGLIVIAILLAVALADRQLRWLVLGLIVPWGLIWSLGFSYDLRNLAMVLPCVGLACGMAIEKLLRLTPISEINVGWDQRAACPATGHDASAGLPWRRVTAVVGRHCGSLREGRCLSHPTTNSRVVHALVASILLVVLACWRTDDNALLAAQHRRQREVGIPDVNAQLYDFQRVSGLHGLVATDYLAMPWLPDLESHRITCSPQDLRKLQAVYQRDDVCYALFCRDGTPAEVWSYLEQPGHPWSSRKVFETKLYRFFVKTGIRLGMNVQCTPTAAVGGSTFNERTIGAAGLH